MTSSAPLFPDAAGPALFPARPPAVPVGTIAPCDGPTSPPGTGTAGGALLDRPELPEPEACPLCGLDPCACAELRIDQEEALADPAPELQLDEWPIARPPVRSGPLGRWRARRAELLRQHGERACCHASGGLGGLSRNARERMQAVEERLSARQPSREQVELARATLATIGGILLTLDEQLTDPR